MSGSAVERLLTRAGLAPDDQVAACLREREALALLAMTGAGVSALALRALIYVFLLEAAPESEIARAFAARRKESDPWCV